MEIKLILNLDRNPDAIAGLKTREQMRGEGLSQIVELDGLLVFLSVDLLVEDEQRVRTVSTCPEDFTGSGVGLPLELKIEQGPDNLEIITKSLVPLGYQLAQTFLSNLLHQRLSCFGIFLGLLLQRR